MLNYSVAELRLFFIFSKLLKKVEDELAVTIYAYNVAFENANPRAFLL